MYAYGLKRVEWVPKIAKYNNKEQKLEKQVNSGYTMTCYMNNFVFVWWLDVWP